MKDVMCLAVGQTYDIVTSTKITAHPDVAPYPRAKLNYLIPIKKGGTLEYLYDVKRQISCMPNDVYEYRDKLNPDEYTSLIEYHELRKNSFGYGKADTNYTFYFLGKEQLIEQPFEKKGIQVSIRLDLEDIPLVKKYSNEFNAEQHYESECVHVGMTDTEGLNYNNERNTQIIEDIENKLDALDIEGEDRVAYIKVRVNQGVFREKLLQRYKKCCLCKVENKALLRASHIKPWADSDVKEKLDVNNGLLLCPNHDVLFDAGFITFDNVGKIIISDRLNQVDKIFMNVNIDMKIELTEGNKVYMEYHKKIIFKE